MSEVGWLVELQTRTEVSWWGRTDDPDAGGVLGWTKNDKDALRFARKADAELLIEDHGWTEVRATEHMWVDPPIKRREAELDEEMAYLKKWLFPRVKRALRPSRHIK